MVRPKLTMEKSRGRENKWKGMASHDSTRTSNWGRGQTRHLLLQNPTCPHLQWVRPFQPEMKERAVRETSSSCELLPAVSTSPLGSGSWPLPSCHGPKTTICTPASAQETQIGFSRPAKAGEEQKKQMNSGAKYT